MRRNSCSKEKKEAAAEILIDADFRSLYSKEIKKLLRCGLGIHHAGLLPKNYALAEKLAQKGLLKVIRGTDTPSDDGKVRQGYDPLFNSLKMSSF